MVIINYHVPCKIVRQFAQYGDESLELDFCPPTGKEKREDRACVVTLHGGGFMGGSRMDEWSYETARELRHKGFAVVNVDYRLGLKGTKMTLSTALKFGGMMQRSIDMAVEDLARALFYLYHNAEKFDIDPHKIILVGCSSGAITALQLGYYIANSVLNQATRQLPKAKRVPLRPAAIVAYSGAILCGDRGVHHEDPIPTMLYHGLNDRIVRPGMTPCSLTKRFYGSERLHEEFKRHEGSLSRMVLFLEAWHEVSVFLPKMVNSFCGFVDDVFAGRSGCSLDVSLSKRVEPEDWMRGDIFTLMK